MAFVLFSYAIELIRWEFDISPVLCLPQFWEKKVVVDSIYISRFVRYV